MYLALEAFVGPSVVLAGLVAGLRDLDPRDWGTAKTAGLFHVLKGFLLRSTPAEVSAARAELEAIYAANADTYAAANLGILLFGRPLVEQRGYKYHGMRIRQKSCRRRRNMGNRFPIRRDVAAVRANRERKPKRRWGFGCTLRRCVRRCRCVLGEVGHDSPHRSRYRLMIGGCGSRGKYNPATKSFRTSGTADPASVGNLVMCDDDGPWVASQFAALWAALAFKPQKWMAGPSPARLFFLGGDAALETELRVVAQYPGTMQADAFASYEHLASPLAVACMKQLAAPGSKVQARAEAWLASRA